MYVFIILKITTKKRNKLIKLKTKVQEESLNRATAKTKLACFISTAPKWRQANLQAPTIRASIRATWTAITTSTVRRTKECRSHFTHSISKECSSKLKSIPKAIYISYQPTFFCRCSSETSSDFVDISNFVNRDRIFNRFCGVNIPGIIRSDVNLLRIQLKTNDVYDARGFQASYQFFKNGIDIIPFNCVLFFIWANF